MDTFRNSSNREVVKSFKLELGKNESTIHVSLIHLQFGKSIFVFLGKSIVLVIKVLKLSLFLKVSLDIHQSFKWNNSNQFELIELNENDYVKRDKQSVSREASGTKERIIELLIGSNQRMKQKTSSSNKQLNEIDMDIQHDTKSATSKAKPSSELNVEYFDYSKYNDEHKSVSSRAQNSAQNACFSKPSVSDQFHYNLASTSGYTGIKSNITISSPTYAGNNMRGITEENLV